MVPRLVPGEPDSGLLWLIIVPRVDLGFVGKRKAPPMFCISGACLGFG